MKNAAILFLICGYFGLAQQQDSIAYKTDNPSLFYSSLKKELHHFAPLFFSLPFKNYTQASLVYQQAENKARSKQIAKKTTDYRIHVDGLYALDPHTILLGDISFTKNYLDDVGYNLSQLMPNQDLVDKSPFYNLAYAEGNWENQLYHINGRLLKRLSDRWIGEVGIKYHVSNFYRLVNPTPKLIYLNLLLNGSIGYRLANGITLGGNFVWGKRNNEISVDYIGKVSALNLPVNVDIYNRISVGFGQIESAKTRRANEREHTQGLGLFAMKEQQNSTYYMSLNYLKKENDFNEVYSADVQLFGQYKVSEYNLRTSYCSLPKKQLISLNAQYKTGSNFRVSTQGKNYEAKLIAADLTYTGIKKAWHYSGGLGLRHAAQKDFQIGNKVSYTNVLPSLGLHRSFNHWYATALIVSQFNLSSSKTLATSNPFVTDVILPQYLLDSRFNLQFKPSLGYRTALDDQMQLDCKLFFNHTYYPNQTNLNGQNTAFGLQLSLWY